MSITKPAVGSTGWNVATDAVIDWVNVHDPDTDGTVSADKIADGTTNKAFSAAEKTKLAGIATSATANATDAQLRDRSTHTGTQPVSTLSATGTASASTYLRGDGAWATPASGGVASVAAADATITIGGTSTAPTVAVGSIAESKVTNLVSDLAGKAAASHTHAASDVASGVLAPARLGSGTASVSTVLRGDGTWGVSPTRSGRACRIYASSTSQSSIDLVETTTVMTFTEFNDDAAMFTPSIADNNVTVVEAGTYSVSYGSGFGAATSGERSVTVRNNGAIIVESNATTSAKYVVTGSRTLRLDAGSVLQLRNYTSGGDAVPILTAGGHETWLSVTYLGPGT